MIQRAGRAAKLPFPVHPHILRHSTGYKLANGGHDTRSLAHYLGHRNLQPTARYTALAEGTFEVLAALGAEPKLTTRPRSDGRIEAFFVGATLGGLNVGRALRGLSTASCSR